MSTAVAGRSAFTVPSFRRLWAAGLISDIGDWFLYIALPVVVLQLGGRAGGTALAFLLELAPPVLLAPLASRLVARLPRRALMVAMNAGQALALVPLAFVHSSAQLPIVYAVIVLHSALATVFEPAKNTLMPDLVGPDHLVSANALVGLNQNLGRLVGGPLGGVVLLGGGLGMVALADAASYLVSAALIATIRSPDPRRRPPEGSPAGILAALRRPRLRLPYALLALASIAQGMFLVLFVLFVVGPLHGSDADVGLLRGIQAVGAIGAGLALGLLSRSWGPRLLTTVSVLAFGAISLATWNLPAVTTDLWPYVALFALVGAPGVLLTTGLISALQNDTAPGERAAVFTTVGLVAAVGQGAGILLAGLADSPVGLGPLLDVQGALYLAAGGFGLIWARRAGRPA